MANIIDKLKQLEDKQNAWDDWSLAEQKELLDIYLVISKKENQIFDLIYDTHGCDSWERIFRDYSERYLENKAYGVEDAVQILAKRIEDTEEVEPVLK